jgi:phage terminase large subunit-like protein
LGLICANATQDEPAHLADVLADGGWRSKARPSQLPPPGDWRGWVVCAGRGFGKSWVAANYANEAAETVGRIALIAPTAAEVRDVMVEGESGILNTAPPWFRPTYEPSKRKVEWPNGAVATCFSAQEPDRLRGPQFELGILEEFAAWDNMQETWDMFQFGLRLGKQPRWLMATTPRPVKLLKEIMARDDVVVTRGSTFENEANLAPPFLEAIKRRYEGTRLGRQEMYAELLTDTPGALWQQSWLDRDRVKGLPGLAQSSLRPTRPSVRCKDAINQDGGVALAAYSSGQASADSEITKLVNHAKTSAEAAAAATAALPHAETALANARSQVVELAEQKNAELNRVLAVLADEDAQSYKRAFDLVGLLHDRLVGYASVVEGNQGDVRLIQAPLSTPRFALPSLGNADADPFLRHRTSELTVNESAQRWSTVRDRAQSRRRR